MVMETMIIIIDLACMFPAEIKIDLSLLYCVAASIFVLFLANREY